MITKDLARRWCAAFNAAKEGEYISLMPDLSIRTGETEADGCWFSKLKHLGESFESTQSAFHFLRDCERRSIELLNEAAE